MIKKIILFIGVITILLTLANAEELKCQYNDTEDYKEEGLKQILKEDNSEYTKNPPLNISEIKEYGGGFIDPCKIEFKITNTYPWDITANLSFTLFYPEDGRRFPGKYGPVTIRKDYYEIVRMSWEGCSQIRIDWKTWNYTLSSPIALETRRELLTFSREICKKCNGNICKDDGAICTGNSECGSNKCIIGICSSSDNCYNNDCKCSSDEVQCEDNKRCVKINVVPLDVRPGCNKPQECQTGYINSTTGVCAKSPTQLKEEEAIQLKEQLARKEQEKKFLLYVVFSLLFLGVLGIIVFWNYKLKHEKEKQKTLEAETEAKRKIEEARQKSIEIEAKANRQLEEEKQKTLDKTIANQKLELEKINKKVGETEEQKAEIALTKRRLEEEIRNNQLLSEKAKVEREKVRNENILTEKEINKNVQLNLQRDKEARKPYFSKNINRWVYKNPRYDFYECFYNRESSTPESNNLVHIWVWKKAHGRNPQPGHEIHHVDFDKYNNSPENLKELTKEEHRRLHGII